MAQHYGPRIVHDPSLVLHLDAAENISYPDSGTTWTDLSGNGNNATLSGSTTAPNHNIGTVSSSLNTMAFDGSGDYCFVAHDSTIEPIVALTYELWINGVYTPAGEVTLMMKNDGNISPYFGKRFWLYANGTAGELRSDIYNGTSYVKLSNAGSPNLTANTWHHVVWTVLDGDFIKFYVDSVLQSTHDISSVTDILKTDDEKLAIGARYHAHPSVGDRRDHFDGHISIVRMYNRALSSKEVLQNYNAQRGRFGV